MKASNDFSAVERHWTAFLVSAGRVFTKLEQGAKTNGKSSAWFGRKINERRTDPLLCYLWHARNADEHTLENVTKLNPGYVKVTQAHEIDPKEQQAMHAHFEKDGRPYAILGIVEGVWPHPELMEVMDRGKHYMPPTTHLGQKLAETSPAHIGDLALAYLSAMLAEAEHLAT